LALAAVASAAPVTSVTVQSGPGTAGTADPNVQVSSDNGATWSQAFNVAPNSRYSTIPGTGWDSVSSNGSAGSGDFLYQASINVPANAVNPSLSGSYYSDNRGSASVNGTQVAQNNACDGGSGEFADYGFNGAPATTFSSGLNTGSNTISFAVNNCASGPTGVDFTATASFTLAPTSKDDCKNDGWENLTDRNGTSFKNQGDCVSYVATGGRNLAAG
jgi:hypothetical protein